VPVPLVPLCPVALLPAAQLYNSARALFVFLLTKNKNASARAHRNHYLDKGSKAWLQPTQKQGRTATARAMLVFLITSSTYQPTNLPIGYK